MIGRKDQKNTTDELEISPTSVTHDFESDDRTPFSFASSYLQSIEAKTPDFSPEFLHQLVDTNDLQALSEYIEDLKPFIDTLQDGLAPIHRAILRHNVSMTRMLLSEGCDPNIRTNGAKLINDGATPLHLAVKVNNFGIAFALKVYRADTSLKDSWRKKIESYSIRLNNYAIAALNTETKDLHKHVFNAEGMHCLETLIEAFPSFIDRNRQFKQPFPHLATIYNRDDIIELLATRYSLDFNQKNIRGQTPLFLAAKNAYKPAIRALIKGGAYIDEINTEQFSEVSGEIKRYIRRCYAIVNAWSNEAREEDVHEEKTETNFNPEDTFQSMIFDLEKSSETLEEMVAKLEEYKTCLNQTLHYQTGFYETALHFAIDTNCPVLAMALLQLGINTHLKDSNGSTPLSNIHLRYLRQPHTSHLFHDVEQEILMESMRNPTNKNLT
ncbi:MAG: ankyrin repeat domain-containing protein [Gammaproteobacteria bacterium]